MTLNRCEALGANLNVLLIWFLRPRFNGSVGWQVEPRIYTFEQENTSWDVFCSTVTVKVATLQMQSDKVIERTANPTCGKRIAALHALWSMPRQPPTCLRSQAQASAWLQKFVRYIGSQSRLAQGIAIPLPKKTIRPTNPNAHHAKHFLHKNYSNYNSAVFFPCYCTMVDCGVWTGECRARSVECTVEMCGM